MQLVSATPAPPVVPARGLIKMAIEKQTRDSFVCAELNHVTRLAKALQIVQQCKLSNIPCADSGFCADWLLRDFE